MKKKLSTRIFSIFLAVLMAVSIIPVGAITANAAIAELYWPVRNSSGTAIKKISNPYDGSHHGIDIAAGVGNKWYAAYDGTVYDLYKGCVSNGFNKNHKTTCSPNHTSAGSYFNGACNYGLGNGVIIKCTINGVTYFMQYAHMNSVNGNLKKGQKISKGTYLGTVGDRGYSFGAHAHFEINKNDTFKNYVNNDPTQTGCKFTYNYNFKATKPSVPKITSNLSGNIALNSNVTVSWSKVSNATGYIVKVNGKQVQKNSSTKYAFTANTAQKYEITVSAYNSAGTSSASNKITVTAQKPRTVIFKDYDGTVLTTQSVGYGKSATPPKENPTREGYSFAGWDKSYNNVTQDLTITATYKINTYTVKFTDKDGNILSTQKVEYLKDAVEPEDKNVPAGYEFLGWNSKDYLSVKSNVTVQGIYSWANTDLPVIAEITSAKRQDDGYYITFDLTNYPDAITRGRAVVALKTEEGKLIDATESAAFSLPKSGTKTGMEVFVPCDKAATTAEIIIVNDYSSGVPISEKVSSEIDQGLMWTEWSTTKPDASNTDLIIESRTEYRYRDKETSTANTKTKDGWIWDGTSSSKTGSWSSWQDSKITAFTNESTKREVATQKVNINSTKTVYRYFRYSSSQHALWGNWYKTSTYKNKYTYEFSKALTYKGIDADHKNGTNAKYYYYKCSCSTGYHYFYSNNGNLSSNGATKVSYVSGQKTQYRYRDTNYTYNFYRWKDWSDWSDASVAESDSREVETRTTYRYKSNDAGIEDTTGQMRTISGVLDSSFAGKQATLFIYKVDEASDYSNEYVAQTVIGENGEYNFTFKLREEPSVKTGDFTIALGIEGTTNTTVIGTIEAPKPQYTVNFYDYNGNIIDTQSVNEGDSATAPDAIEREGYTFECWDTNITNIKEDLDVYPVYEQNEYTVIFVNWQTDTIQIENFLYGEPLTVPKIEPIEGYNLTGWEGISDSEMIVTQNMVATAKYDKEIYDVNFYDFDGNVISAQKVAYGESADVPEDLSADNVIFLGWSASDSVDYTEVTEDMDLIPQYVFEETVSDPVADIKTGVYTDRQTVTLTCDTPDSVIYYTTDGTDPKVCGKIYTEPVVISQHCELRFIACAFEMNDSNEISEYYCINNPDIPSEWMPYEDLPETVINNFDSYRIEMETGYRYKDTQQVYDNSIATQLISDGWIYSDSTYTEFTPWQDEIITDDGTKPGFEIETRIVADPSVTRYQYSHYKYTDNEGVVHYSRSEVDGYDCEYETIVLDDNLSIAGFENIDGSNVSYFNYNDQKWYSQTKVNGEKTQYRSRYQVDEYYKWTDWTTDAPDSDDNREYETSDIYRYYCKNNYIVSIPNYGESGLTLLVQENETLDLSEYEDVPGYDLEGLYSGEDLSVKYELTTPVTECLTLYMNFVPEVYTVEFRLEDGTVLDTQEVSYMEAAQEPKTDVVDGYIFVGWDKDFDFITEDTVVMAKYIPEDEYTTVSLDRSSAVMYQGNTLNLVATVTPAEYADEAVEWYSSDPGVAFVDGMGKVTAESAGEAIITVKVVKTNETASCAITVASDLMNYITLKQGSAIDIDELGYLRRVSAESSVAETKEEFLNDSLEFYDINGNKLDSEDYVGTGAQVKLINNDDTADSKSFVITGDMTGDGIINNRDVATLNKELLDKVSVSECQLLAADVNGDGYVNNRDAAMISRYLVGKETF